MLDSAPEACKKVSKEGHDVVRPIDESHKGVWEKHPNQIKQDTEKEKVPDESHGSLLSYRLKSLIVDTACLKTQLYNSRSWNLPQ